MIKLKNCQGGFFVLQKESDGMRSEHKDPYRIYRVGGKIFLVYLEYDQELNDTYPVYPDFTQNPEYTEEGRPFSTSAQEACPYSEAQTSKDPIPSDCGGCIRFHRDSSPYDPIGVCICDARRLKPESKEDN